MLYAIAVLVILILDQSVKYWTVTNIALNTGEKAFLPGILRLVHIRNTGAAFGMLENGRWFFLILTVVFIAGVAYVLAKGIVKGEFGSWMLIFALAGGLGNAIDRALYGYVVDMFEPTFINFAVFNVADIFINIGGIGFCLYILFSKEEMPEKAPKKVRSNRTAAPVEARTSDSDHVIEQWDEIFGAAQKKTETESAQAPAHQTAEDEAPRFVKAHEKLTLAEKLSAISVARRAARESDERAATGVGIESITRESLRTKYTPADPAHPFAEWEKDNGEPEQVAAVEPEVEPAKPHAEVFVRPEPVQSVKEPEPVVGAKASEAVVEADEKVSEWDKLLEDLPDLGSDSFAADMLTDIPDSDDETYSLEDILAEFSGK